MSAQHALTLMRAFAARTGVHAAEPGPQRRYLWTDAFAVCNFLALDREGGTSDLAMALIERVHHELGRHRADDARVGWLSGLPEDEGARHPTRGGLRIGKPLPERSRDEPFDAEREWERDGQYFHYLTKWMHALDKAARAMERPMLNLWARELAQTAYAGFAKPMRGRGLAWKMSIDLSRPAVAAMGQHDPLDGLVTFVQLQATARALGCDDEGPDLVDEVQGLAAMTRGGRWVTDDLLGIGGLLMDAARVRQLADEAQLGARDLLPELLGSALVGLRNIDLEAELRRAPSRRLAFRELGLAIGLHAVELLDRLGPADATHRDVTELLRALGGYVPIAAVIEAFWLESEHRTDAHRDIDEVMLATSLVPRGVLDLSSVTA